VSRTSGGAGCRRKRGLCPAANLSESERRFSVKRRSGIKGLFSVHLQTFEGLYEVRHSSVRAPQWRIVVAGACGGSKGRGRNLILGSRVEAKIDARAPPSQSSNLRRVSRSTVAFSRLPSSGLQCDLRHRAAPLWIEVRPVAPHGEEDARKLAGQGDDRDPLAAPSSDAACPRR
jgi:hypothetical protein